MRPKWTFSIIRIKAPCRQSTTDADAARVHYSPHDNPTERDLGRAIGVTANSPTPLSRATPVTFLPPFASATAQPLDVAAPRSSPWLTGDYAEPHASPFHAPSALPVPGRPLRSVVAEEWSTEGVRDRTGPEPDAHEIAHGTRRDTAG
jgi:hypothetical protein